MVRVIDQHGKEWPSQEAYFDAEYARLRCVPLCGASKAYGRFDEPWKHEPQCPVRMAWEATRTRSTPA